MFKLDKDKCLRCGGCVGICPVDALELTETGIVCNEEKCIKCRNCESFCPIGAIKIKKEEK